VVYGSAHKKARIMAQAKIKRRRATETKRTEFVVPLERVLNDLLDPDQVQEGDVFSFVDGNQDGLIICRDRTTQQQFDENGDPIP
jgi:hypothetical protein